ncbi:MAG: YceI family protein [Calditrichia bacterium]|jgi:polyisoprenoid-binding protein YceI
MLRNIIVSIVSIVFLVSMSFSAEKYVADKAHSNIGFEVKHLVFTTVPGKFQDYQVEFVFDQNDLSNSSINAAIKTASIDTDNEKRDNHLVSADFFDAEQHPEITFMSKEIMKSDDGYVAKGTLTMRGVSREIELPFKILGTMKDPWGNTKMGVESELTINRQDYNVNWNKPLDAGGVLVSNDVKIKLELQLQEG